MAEAHLDALRFSGDRLRKVATGLSDADLAGQAYPEEWTVAQVLSHLGSGAAIMQRQLEDALAGQTTPDDFPSSVWDVWNAKSPRAQRDDSLAAEDALLNRLEASTREERIRFVMSMGPTTLGFTDLVALRLNEHAFHTWDVEVAGDPGATIPAEITELVIDNLDLVARYTAKPTGDTKSITVATTRPERGFTIDLTVEAVTFQARPHAAAADLELPAEAFARLVYGRLSRDVAPGRNEAALDLLRRVFPGP